MRKKRLNHNRMIALILALLMLFSAFGMSAGAVGELPEKNEQPRHVTCTALSKSATAYYTGDCRYEILSQLSGAADVSSSEKAMENNALFDKLHDLMANTHTYFATYSGYKAGSLAYFWNSTDASVNSESYLMFYSDVPSGEGVKLNREHIWPKSRASFNQKFGGADLHHLRPAVDSINNLKSDHLFGFVSGTYSSGIKEGAVNGETCCYVYQKDDLFECKDDVKGDVARILLYVYCRWRQPNLYSAVESENLPSFDSDDSANSGKPVIESLETLLRWCANDPVDSWEMARNDLSEAVQGNRNVFIDYPELAWKLFNKETPAGLTTPTKAGCEHHFEEVARTPAVCGTDGSFMLRCSLCGDSYTRRLAAPASSHEDKNDDGWCDLCHAPLRELLGDTDGDKQITVVDATLIQRVIAAILSDAFSERAADVDGDEKITVIDATFIQRYLASLSCPEGIGQPIA